MMYDKNTGFNVETTHQNFVVIPIEVWTAKDLSWNERLLLIEIYQHTGNEHYCFMSNAYIAHFLNTSEKNASKLLNSLIKKGYVVVTRFDGRKRFVSSTLRYGHNIQNTSRETCRH